jgi:hypothetical protein
MRLRSEGLHGLNGAPYGRDAADDDQAAHPHRCATEQGVHAHQEIDAGFDHGCRVQKGADGRRGTHGIGQPEMKRHLGGLGHGTQQDGRKNSQVEWMLADLIVRRYPLAESKRSTGRFYH